VKTKGGVYRSRDVFPKNTKMGEDNLKEVCEKGPRLGGVKGGVLSEGVLERVSCLVSTSPSS